MKFFIFFLAVVAFASQEDPVDRMLKNFEIHEQGGDPSAKSFIQEQEKLEAEIHKFRRENTLHPYTLRVRIVESEDLSKTFGGLGEVASKKRAYTAGGVKSLTPSTAGSVAGPAQDKKKTLRSYTLETVGKFLEENR